MDDSNISFSSTPSQKRGAGRIMISESDESDQEEKGINVDIEIPETDHEESLGEVISDPDTPGNMFEIASPIARSHMASRKRSSIFKSVGEVNLDGSESSKYLSFSSEDLSPIKDDASDSSASEILSESDDDSGDEHHRFKPNAFAETSADSVSGHTDGSFRSEANLADENESKLGLEDAELAAHTDADHSGQNKDEIASVHTDASESHISVFDISVQSSHSDHSIQNGSESESDGSDDNRSNRSDFASLNKVDKAEESPMRLNVIDLTQSDHSLQNSPVGATRQVFPNQRVVADIVAELSSVANSLMVKEALLESINKTSLPDNGRNLIRKVLELKKQKADLEKELHECKEYAAQKKGLEQLQDNRSKILAASKQTTLNFQPTIKMEARERANSYSEEDDSPRSTKSHGSNFPNWDQLPKPDMTISGFGKQAMKTHLAEKSLTLDALSKLHSALNKCPTEDTYAEDPEQLRIELLPHQKHGLAWMLWREQERPAGGILADDMGLGKTLSMISLILKQMELKENSEDSRSSDSDGESTPWMTSKRAHLPKGGTLVVCPASLMAQWEREIYKRVKRRVLSVELYHGPKRETKPRRLAQYDVVITTYNLISRESGVVTSRKQQNMKGKGPLFMVQWDRIILDEAHVVRNHKSLMALGVCELQGKRKWCLTGTPIQNKELDLYALLKFLECAPFDDLVVWKRWVDNKNAAGMQRLSTIMKSLMLRRTKEQLHERGQLDCLPDKSFERIDVHLDAEELQLYEKVALFSTTLFAQFLHQRAEKQQALDARYGITTKPIWEQAEGADNQFTTTEELAILHRKMKGMSDIKTHQILVLLLRLRQICCHPGLVKKMVEDGDMDIGGEVEDASGLDVDLFNQMNNLNINELDMEDGKEEVDESDIVSPTNPVLSFDRPSAKIRAILDLIEEKLLDSDDKAIIVSQWTSMLNIIAKFLKQLQIKFDTLSGEVPVDKRQDIVNALNRPDSGPQVLLLSLTAGGVGLNLTGANHLLLVDIHWNPQLETQACDRIYRVGQKKSVHIYRFITVDTIEEKIKMIQDMKLTLAQNVLTGTNSTQVSKLTLDDLKMLFSVPSSQPEQDAAVTLPFSN